MPRRFSCATMKHSAQKLTLASSATITAMGSVSTQATIGPFAGRTLLKRRNERGPDGLADGRKGNGSAPALTPARAG